MWGEGTAMATVRLQGVISSLRRAVAPEAYVGASDAQLLDRFADERDEAAFELLVWRHAQMVLGSCRRVLRDEHAAEDCFQATFLALARKAATVGQSGSVGGWLHKVASRVALEAKARLARQEARERPLGDWPHSAQPEPCDVAGWRELEALVDEEVNRLPGKYRESFVLCVLAGKTNAEAAGELGCPAGTVASRVARARERLRAALARRGFRPPAACALALGSAPVRVPLVGATVKAAALFAADKGIALAVVPPQVVALARGALRSMFMAKIKVAVWSLLFMAGLAAAGLTYQARAAQRVGDLAFAPEKGLEKRAPSVVTVQTKFIRPARPLADADKKLLATLLVLDKQWWEASGKQDRDTLDRLLADDYVALVGSARYTKADSLRIMRHQKPADWKVTSPVEMVRLNEKAAVLTYEARWKGLTARGEHVSNSHNRITVCWVQRGGGWFIVFCQETAVGTK
jgi:RNA polymerase sigma factor (sigma-70 family)